LQMHFHLFTEKNKLDSPKTSTWNYNFEAARARPFFFVLYFWREQNV
jgi:hypothetical protein